MMDSFRSGCGWGCGIIIGLAIGLALIGACLTLSLGG